VKKLLAEAMPLFRSYQKNVKRLVQLRDPQPHRHHTSLVRTAPSLRADMIFRMDNLQRPWPETDRQPNRAAGDAGNWISQCASANPYAPRSAEA